MLTQVIVIIFMAVLFFRIGRFFLTPFLKRIGFIKYYSPMFCTFKMGTDKYDFHLGTSWDFFIQKKISPKKTLHYLSKGLVNLCTAIEEGKINKEARFKGNTFYLNESTARKFGFKTRKLNTLESLLFIQNYIELCILNSIIHRRVTLIKLNNVRIVFANGVNILQNKNRYQTVLSRFEDVKQYRFINISNKISRRAKVV